MKQRSPELQNLMRHLYQVFATYWLLDDVQTFYETMPPNSEHLNYFFGGKKSKIEVFQDLLKTNLGLVGMSAKEITDGFDFDDRELLSVIARKEIKNSDQLYSEILRVVRLNPLNKNSIPKGFTRYIHPLLIGKL
jgi:hypothetical protein